MVVQDIFFSETCRFADIILPASPSLEKEGTFVSTERRIQRFYETFEPLGDSKPDWEIYQLIAQKLGGAGGWNYKHPSEVMDEVAGLTPTFAGVSYERLEGYNTLQWPVAKDGTDQPCLYLGDTPFPLPDGLASFWPLEYVPPSEEQNATYDLHLNNGRLLEHFEQGNLSYRVPGIKEMTPEVFVEVSPELARERGLESGQWVQLESPYGFVRVKVLVTQRVSGRQMYMPLNSSTHPVNRPSREGPIAPTARKLPLRHPHPAGRRRRRRQALPRRLPRPRLPSPGQTRPDRNHETNVETASEESTITSSERPQTPS